ncbi:chymotrypsin-elastase inhibitor ixodidin-like isoform X1 [Dermacentor variabilis]|uniref:chymotrypsin-elastase inhibitor ixodidin-like isoform X1 n=1 Tax=Dermacentor variabilis TaxID=34621 RepID=UPI003F5B0EFE
MLLFSHDGSGSTGCAHALPPSSLSLELPSFWSVALHYKGGFLERPCSPREVYLQCGTACPRICGRPARTFCTYQCVSGCFCARGFIRTAHGNCIPENQCYYRG